MKRIAVIGGGLFGCEIAYELQNRDQQITLFEQKTRLMESTSKNNSRRVHLGFHYPRHIQTARQSLRGSSLFTNKYRNYIFNSFSNYYGIAKASRTSVNSYDVFLRKLNAPYQICSYENTNLSGLKYEQISKFYQVPEFILKIEELAKYFQTKLSSLGVDIQLGTTVTSISQKGKFWSINDEKENSFDGVVIATHGQEDFAIFSDDQPLVEPRLNEYHVTQILIANIPKIEAIGLTIIDGDFLTLLPIDSMGNFSIYSPSASRLRVQTSLSNPFTQETLFEIESKADSSRLIKSFYDWFDKSVDLEIINSRFAVRCIPADSHETDQRISQVQCLYPKILKIYSTKLDHCVEIASDVRDYFTKIWASET